MNRVEEAAFDRRVEEYFKGYQPPPDGRDYRCFRQVDIREDERVSYRENFDKIFPGAPGFGF